MYDFDDYLEYKMFEDSLKKDKLNAYIKKTNQPGSKYPPIRMEKKKNDLGCGGWLILIILVFGTISLFGSCGKSSSKSYSSGRTSYSSSYSSSRSSSSNYGSSSSSNSSGNKPYSGCTSKPSSGSSNKSKSSSSDSYDAKSYAHPDDFYYDYYDDFWDYEDVKDYWEEHQDD